METIKFGFVITGTNEAVLIFGSGSNKRELIYNIDGLNSLAKKYGHQPHILAELELARVALCDDALLDYQPENTRFDEPPKQQLILKETNYER